MLHLSLSAHPSSAGEARRFAAEVLREWNEDPLEEPVVLLVSELVTNAVLHAGSPVRVALGRRNGHIWAGVSDESAVMPGLRDYDDEALTGRGLELVDMIAERWGVDPREPEGKTVWFELPATQPQAVEDDELEGIPVAAGTPRAAETVTVRLLGTPVRLFPAVQEHTDALLREYALIGLQSDQTPTPPRLTVDLNPITEQMAAAGAAGNATAEIVLEVPVTARTSVIDVCEALDDADTLAANGQLLQSPPLPEIRGCRDWFFDQLLTQLEGGEADPWVATMGTEEVVPGADIDFAAVLDELDDAVVIADDRNHIAYANAAVEALLGWSPDELAGRRLTAIIPPRLHEAHIAGYTRYLVTRRPRLIGDAVRVPARRRDGEEVEVELRLHTFRPPGAAQMFIGVLHRPAPVEQRAAATDPLAVLDAMTEVVTNGDRDIERLLATVGTALGRRFTAWWSVSGEELRCAAVWSADDERDRSFAEATRRRRFTAGEGLPGRVWASGRAEWIPDLVADANFPRVGLAVQHHLRTAVAFPVITAGRIIGVVEALGDNVTPADPALLQALMTAGRLLGLGRR